MENNKKILVVEDDFPAARVMQLKLGKLGFHVDYASDGQMAMEKLKAGAYDVMLLDLRLPKKSGFEIITEVRSDPKLAHIKIFVLSNLGQKEDLDKALKLGADNYFIKADTNIHDLIEKITALLSASSEN